MLVQHFRWRVLIELKNMASKGRVKKNIHNFGGILCKGFIPLLPSWKIMNFIP